MADAVEGLLGKGDRIGATDGHVTGVEAEVDVTAIEHHLDVVIGLHQRLHVGMHDLIEAVLGADLVDDGEHLHHVPALVESERTRDRPVGVHDDRGDEFRRTRTLEEIGHATSLCDGCLPHRGVVQDHRCESADECHVVRRQRRLHLLR